MWNTVFDALLLLGAVDDMNLFRSTGGSSTIGCAVRPVVSLSATKLLDFSVGDGTKENPWGMK